MAQPMTPEALQQLMASDHLHAVIDVRPRASHAAGQIFLSTNVPLEGLAKTLPAVVPAKTVRVVAVGEDEGVSADAARQCESLGFRDVFWLSGGFAGWVKAGLPTIDGWSVPGKDFGERLLVQEPVPEIEAEDLASRLARHEDLLVLDCRTPAEFGRSCIPGARSVPGGQLPLVITDIVSEHAGAAPTIVVNCAGRTRSILGAFQLQRMGIPNVLALRNGTMGFMLAGHTLQTHASPGPKQEASPESVAAAERVAAEIAARDGVRLISVAELNRLRATAADDPLYIVDVRLPEEYLAGHVPGALTCPGSQVPFSDDQIAVRGATIVTVCDGRARAIFAASLWRLMGFPRVCALDGGTAAWTAAGLELESGGEERPFRTSDRTREEMIAYLEWEEALGEKYRSPAGA